MTPETARSSDPRRAPLPDSAVLFSAGLDSAVLLAKDIATGVRLERGRCIYPQENGTGVRLIDGPLSARTA